MSGTSQPVHHLLPTWSNPHVKTGIPEFRATCWLVDRTGRLVCNTVMKMMMLAVLAFSGYFLLYFKSFVFVVKCPQAALLLVHVAPCSHCQEACGSFLCLYSCSFPKIFLHWINWMNSSVSLNATSLSTAGFVRLYLHSAPSVLSAPGTDCVPDNSKLDWLVWLESNIQ